MRSISKIILGSQLIVAACLGTASEAASAKGGKVVVTTDSNTPSPKPPFGLTVDAAPSALEAKVRSDGLKAATLLRKIVCDKSDAAPWAAVYLRRLEVVHDEACGATALIAGTHADDPLLRALSWRHLAVAEAPLPKWGTRKETDPTVMALAAVAFAVRGEVPAALLYALTLPSGKPNGSDRKQAVEKRTNHLGALGLPFDDGPVALALAFVEMRAKGCVIGKGKNAVFAASALRTTLLGALIKSPRNAARRLPEAGTPPKGQGDVAVRLANPMVTRSPETLRAIVLTGATELRLQALRAIATTAEHPAAGDLAAAAAAMSSEGSAIRVEGARTFLLLLKRLR